MNSEKLLRLMVRRILSEDLKNVRSKHEKTVAGTTVLRLMHDAQGVLPALSQITSPTEMAQVIEALLDAVPMVSRRDVLEALMKVMRHEKATRR